MVSETEEDVSEQTATAEYSQYPQNIYYANIISCFENEDRFFLSIDPFDENSVVELSRSEKVVDFLAPFEARRIFVANNRYRNVTVLKYRDIFL